MSHELRLQDNIDLWSRHHPKEAIFLQAIDPTTLKTIPNISEDWLSSLDLGLIKTFYLYGIGQGDSFQILLNWLDAHPDHQLIYLEDDLRVIYQLFESENGALILEHPQVRLVYFENVDESQQTLENLYWNSVKTPFAFTAHPHYLKQKEKQCSELHHKLAFDAAVKDANLDEYLQYGFGFFRNYYANLKLLPESLFGNHLFGKFQNVPAVICGAGPSLEKQLNHLKQLKDKALIFGGSSSLNALLQHGITPHFGAGVDPNPPQLERIQKLSSTEFPFFYRNRMYHPALKEIKGPRLYVTGAGGYDIAEWIEERLVLPIQEIEEGHNVMNFCLQIATLLGCNPIIFIGMDLAFTDMKQYAPGVLEDSSLTKDQLLHTSDFNQEALSHEDIYGKPTYTLWKWITEAKWIGEFAQEHPEVTVLNATEGGIGFPDVSNEFFAEVIQKHFSQSLNLQDQIQERLKEAKLHGVSQEKVSEVLGELRGSLSDCIEHLDVLIAETELAISENRDQYEQSGLAALAETDLAEEPAFEAVLSIFNNAYTKMLQRELEQIKYMTEGRAAKIYQVNLKKYEFLRNVARVNLEIMNKVYFG